MGSLLDIGDGIADAPEPKVVPAGEEYKLRILDCRQDIDKNQHPYIMPRFDVDSEPHAKDFTCFIGLQHDEMDEKERFRARSDLRKFLEAFGLPTSGQLDIEDMKGKTGWAILGVKEDDQYGEQNTIRKFIAPK